jgi:C4-dicarboxylate-specific signal transduction histidine kinase
VLLTVPVFVAQSYPTHPLAAFLSGVTGGAGAMVLMRAADRPWIDTLFWSFMPLAGALLGMHGAAQSRRTIAAQEQARSEQARRQLIEQLAKEESVRAHSDKLATLGRLAANVLHELNNPLAFVRSNLEFLRRELRAPPTVIREEVLEVLDETRAGVERIQQISSDLRSFSRIDDAGSARCSLKEAVTSTLRIAALRLQHVASVRVELPEDLPVVHANPQRMIQVLLNLLVNAGDALAQRKEGAEVSISARQEESRVVLLVEDNGPGIPADVLPRLFEPFFTTKGPEKGTGLGLALSREIIEKFNGSLTAENRPEGGARMRITLQAVAASD